MIAPGGNEIRIALVASALSMRLGLRAILGEVPGVIITREASTLEEFRDSSIPADILLLAGRVATSPGLERLLGKAAPETGVLLLLEEPPLPGFFARLAPRAWGAISLDCTPHELSAAIQATASGLAVADPALLQNQFTPSPFVDMDDEDFPGEKLTPRETEVLQQLAFGLANKQIAGVLGMSENTVKFHISSIYTKLGAGNRAEAVRLGARKGFIIL